MSVGLGVPSASALFFNNVHVSPRMQRDHCILRTDIKRGNETRHHTFGSRIVSSLRRKRKREDIFFFPPNEKYSSRPIELYSYPGKKELAEQPLLSLPSKDVNNDIGGVR